MEIHFGNYRVIVENPILCIESNCKVSTRTEVNLEFVCSAEEYRVIYNSCIVVNDLIPTIKIENGNQLFILNDCVLTNINYTSMVGVSVKDAVKTNITIVPKTIQCENLADLFIE